MDQEQDAKPARSRFGNVVNAKDVAEDPPFRNESGSVHAASRELAVALNARDLGYSVTRIESGATSCPYHFHHSEEEMFFVLEGRGVLRQGLDGEGPAGEERIELGPGDCVSFPPGTRIAHQFSNPHPEPFVYLAFSNRLPHDVAEYPDSDKVNIRATRTILRRAPKLGYFDGEP